MHFTWPQEGRRAVRVAKPQWRRLCAAAAGAVAITVLPAATPAAGATPGPSVQEDAARVVLTVPAAAAAPGYTVVVDKAPFRVTTLRGAEVILRSLPAVPGQSGPADFRTASGWYTATSVSSVSWRDGVLDLVLSTTSPADTVRLRITPAADRYRAWFRVEGTDAADTVATHYVTSSAGHWYGHGEANTPQGTGVSQPWPLDTGQVRDTAFGPAEYLMTDPFWFTSKAVGLWVDTRNLMDVSLNSVQADVFGFNVDGTDTLDHTVFVERTPRAVYRDYVGITGTPAKSDATELQYREPLWNSWAQFYTSVSEDKALSWARGLHDAGVPGHTIQVDDGWMSHYGDFTFNDKFPTPRQMSDEIHRMGYDFGLWVTLWINQDAANYAYAASHGYLLRSTADPSQPCTVTWWNGTAGIVDLANPEARSWYVGQLRTLQSDYGVDGFKFDTRFFDEQCAPYPGHTALDYLQLGAELTDQFDQQGAGVRISWTGSQRYGFVTRQVDKYTDWRALRAAVSQNLAISTIGYPFVETDMIGGSLGGPPPTKQVLVRWAQAAALMPLMYSSTSPAAGYDAQTVELYKAAVALHERLTPYILQQVDRAVATGEPIMKPIFFEFPSDAASYTVDDEWLLGDSLLAAPVVADATGRHVHLPAGSWYDVQRGRLVKGPAELASYQADLTEIPMFIRLGGKDTDTLMRALGVSA
jgi:alpha-glucosidase (family GH31 glycosyl hydrolase)